MSFGQTVKTKLPDIFSVALLLAATVCFFGPSKIYLTNPKEFNFLYSELLMYLFIIAIISFIILTLVMVILREFYLEKTLSILCVTAVLFWIQGNLLVWNYGVLDGRPINWNEKTICGLLDAGVWIVLLFTAVIKSTLVKKHVRTISLFFIIIQLLSTALLLQQQPDIPTFKQYSLNTDDKFTFSKDNNVILLILDGFQTDIFQEIIDEDASYRKLFDGFIYFRNSLAGFNRTTPSIPFLLTAQQYDNSEKFESFLKKAYLSDSSILKILKENGYKVEIYPLVPQTIYFNEKILSNLKEKKFTDYRRDVFLVYAITAFRYTPNFVKRKIYNHPALFSRMVFPNALDASVYTNTHLRDFIAEMSKKIKLGTAGRVFKFFHHRFPHPPLEINEKMEFEKMEFSRSNFKRQAKATLGMVKQVLEMLKKNDIYDKSMIVIVADHGMGLVSGYPIKYNDSSLPAVTDAKIARGLPLILVKKFTGHGPLMISNAPVSLSDISPTIANETGLDTSPKRPSIFQIPDAEKRERRILFYDWNWKNLGWEKDYLPNMQEYIVDGFSWLPSSWKKDGRIYLPAQ